MHLYFVPSQERKKEGALKHVFWEDKVVGSNHIHAPLPIVHVWWFENGNFQIQHHHECPQHKEIWCYYHKPTTKLDLDFHSLVDEPKIAG